MGKIYDGMEKVNEYNEKAKDYAASILGDSWIEVREKHKRLIEEKRKKKMADKQKVKN